MNRAGDLILDVLAKSPATFVEILAAMPELVSESQVRRGMRNLFHKGLIRSRPDGTYVDTGKIPPSRFRRRKG